VSAKERTIPLARGAVRLDVTLNGKPVARVVAFRVRDGAQPEHLHNHRFDLTSDVSRKRFVKELPADVREDAAALLKEAGPQWRTLGIPAQPLPGDAPMPAAPVVLEGESLSLARRADILSAVTETLAAMGVAGEAATLKLIYLVVTSRLVEAPLLPVSLAVTAVSSAGKSYLVAQTLKLFPPSAYYALTAMSERALAYSEESLAHRVLVLYEAAGVSGEFGLYLLRSLLSEGCVRYEVVDKTDDGLKARLIERAGPTGLIVTTTRDSVHAENDTRMLAVGVSDAEAHTRAIVESFGRQVAGESPDAPDADPWRALQAWLQGAERRVAIPFGGALGGLVVADAVRMRRDFRAVLSLIAAHAILHQATRDRDAQGRIAATAADYAAVYDLVAELLSHGTGATVPKTVRDTVAAVAKHYRPAGAGEPERFVTLHTVATELQLEKSAAKDRVSRAIKRGFLVNTEPRSRQPMQLRPGDPMPDRPLALPTPPQLFGALAGSRDWPAPPPGQPISSSTTGSGDWPASRQLPGVVGETNAAIGSAEPSKDDDLYSFVHPEGAGQPASECNGRVDSDLTGRDPEPASDTRRPVTDADWEALEERAGILEYDGGLPRDEAERLAWRTLFGEPA